MQRRDGALADFWDTAGQERFSSMHPSYYYKAHSCILVFDVTRKTTYMHLKDWFKELRKFCENIPVLCVANKIDVDIKARGAWAPAAARGGWPADARSHGARR